MRVVAVTNCIIDNRLSLLNQWLSTIFVGKRCLTMPLTGDASFRRYFRTEVAGQTYVVMDAPPDKENCDAFIRIAGTFKNTAVRFPTIIAQNLEHGFLLLNDFGDQQLLPILTQDSADRLYRLAIDALIKMQSHPMAHDDLPHFNDALYWREFEILDTWYIKKNLDKKLSATDEKKLKLFYQLLIDSANAQPPIFVHRDYHSRNIMLCDDGELGILDFQDAVLGPITYDLVSLLRDCYIAWPQTQIDVWAKYYFNQLNLTVDFKQFMRWFDFMGLQRHLKCLGIFSRLYYRDGKSGYLKDIPRVLHYAVSVCEQYPELLGLKALLM